MRATGFGIAVALATTPASAQVPSPDREARLDVPVVHAFGLMTVMRTTEAAIWPEPFAETNLYDWAASYGRAILEPPKWDVTARPFEWDGDHWTINVIGHGVFGSELYFRARHCRNGVLTSLLFAGLASATWDYLYEGNRVQPSGLDLWYTPTAGILFGELRHVGWKAAGSIASPFWRGTVRAILDPLGSVERWAGTDC